MKKLGIVIVNWNSLKYTLEFSNAFKKLRPQGSILVVVNNSPEDNEKLSKISSDTVIVLNTNGNLGYAGGLNRGIKYLQKDKRVDWYLLINNDVKLTKDFINDLLQVTDTNTIYSPVIVNMHDDIVQNTGGDMRIFIGGTVNLNKGKHFEKIIRKTPDFLSGCCLFMHKNVVEKVGEMDEFYESYYEDIDYSFRARRKGVKLEVLWNTKLRHHHSMSTKNISGYKDFLITRNSIWFAQKDLSFPRKQIFVFFGILVGFFYVLPRPRNLPFYFRGVKEGLL